MTRAGVLVVHRHEVLTGHQWPAEEDGLVGDAGELADVVGLPHIEVGARALLRRHDRPASELLTALAQLTELPGKAIDLVTADALPHDAVLLAAGPRKGALATAWAVSGALPEPGWLVGARRWQWLLPAMVSLYFAVRAVLAVLAGNGGTGDRIGYALLAAIAASAAVFWHWRGRRGRAAD